MTSIGGTLPDYRERLSRIVIAAFAIAASLTLNVALPMLMMKGASSQATEQSRSEAIQVVWIERDVPEVVEPEPRYRVDKRHDREARKTPGTKPRMPITPTVHAPAALQVVEDDSWNIPTSQFRGQGQDGIGRRFEPNPLGKRQRSFDAPVERLSVTFHDRSVGGRLQQMVKAGICGDLRRGLTASPASSAAIMESMRKNGCID
ncbi:MAG: hypothetical protein ACREVW_04555 [Burkholderiales bacterium]